MKQVQRQQLQQKLSPQQIQLMRLLQLPVTDLEQAIKEELEKNPLLEAELPETTESLDTIDTRGNDVSDWDSDDEDDYGFDYRMQMENDPNERRHEPLFADRPSQLSSLYSQLSTLNLTDRQRLIANELLGTLDDAGYLGRDLALVTNDLAFRQGIDTTPEEVLEVLRFIQALDPPGIGARNLQECLLLQLERSREMENVEAKKVAIAIVRDYFDDFANRRQERICNALGIDNDTFNEAASLIRRLNPKPGGSDSDSGMAAATFIPDIILQQHDGVLRFYLNDGNLPRLNINTYYTDMLAEMETSGGSNSANRGNRETIQFLRTKQADAQVFIDLLRQRHDTIERVMRYIVKHQRRYLLTGNPDLLQPLRQREVAEATGLDVSTVSRMANSKYLQTDFGTIPLKECFSKGMASDTGEEVSVDAIKQRLSDAINGEDKKAPLSDESLTQLLNAQGYPLARRTVAKYREQMGFPVARLRRVVMIMVLLMAGVGCLRAQGSYYDSLIAVRLQTSNLPKTTVVQSTAKPSATQKAESKAVVKAIKKAAKEQEDELDKSVVPLWYDAFPHHRVNPLGRTQVDMLPDEININLVDDSNGFCFPVKNIKTSNYGWRWHRGHHGVDIRLRTGDTVYCAFGGVVRVATRMGGYGNCVVVRHSNGLETLYGHLSKISVIPNQQLVAGDVVGLGGSTGNSTGPHLHFECRFLYQTFDPEWILDFSSFSLRTRRLHLDKSYFGIRQPRKGVDDDFKADVSIIKEQKKGKRRNSPYTYNIKDF